MSEEKTPFFEPTFNQSVKFRARDQRLSSDGGVLILREADNRLGLIDSIASRLSDPRREDAIRYYLDELLRERIFLRTLGYNVECPTIVYTLLGGMEAVIWTDVMQSAVMIVGILFCAVMLAVKVFSQPDYLIQTAFDAHKLSFGSGEFSLTSRTIWVMIIYGITENLRNLIADQNYVQKYASVRTLKEARSSVWTAMLIYIPLTAVFLFIGTTLFAFYSSNGAALPESIIKGDQVFPCFIATQVPFGLRGLIIAAILAAAMSTVDSALNCSATVLLIDFYKRYFRPQISEKASILFLRGTTVLWGILGAGFALLMIKAKSALEVWWQISGIFGGGILGLFLLGLFRIRLRLGHGLLVIGVSILTISWGTFARDLPPSWQWIECPLDPILVGAAGTLVLLVTASVLTQFHKPARG